MGSRTRSSIDDIAYLARSEHRASTLVALTVRPRSRSELWEMTGVSSSTIRRTLSEFEDRNWIRRNEYQYETTQLGAFIASAVAERLGYPASDLDPIPAQALESFASVGYHFDLADLREGDGVLDLSSGSGMDVFVVALQAGISGGMTDQQLTKARQLRDEVGMNNGPFEQGYIEDVPFDVVISNGVINLSLDKQQVFEEANRVLASGGRFAVSDIISEKLMPESIKNTHK